MADIENIREQMAAFSERYGPASIVEAVVTKLNEDETVGVEFDDGSELEDVRLKAIVKEGDQFIVRPAVGSNILIGRIAGSEEYLLIAASEIVEVVIKIGNTKLSVSDKIEIKAGGEDLLSLLKDLIETMINEKHMTNTGPTISLTPDSVTAYNGIKTRFNNLLKSV